MLKFGLISCMLFFSLVITVLPVQGQESNTDCLSEDTQLGRIGNSLEKDQEKMRNEYKLYGDEAFEELKFLPKEIVEQIQSSIETEIIMEKVKTNENIEYKNCSHLNAVRIELTNILNKGDESWNEYWKNQEADLSKKEIKQIKEYIQKQIDATINN